MDGATSPICYPQAEPPAPGEAVEVADGVLWMRLSLPMKLDHVNVYALDEGHGWTVVDTGFDSATTREAWQQLISGPLQGRPVLRAIVTHHHPDHVGLAGWFQSALGAELVTTRTAYLFTRMLQLDVQDRQTQAQLDFWRLCGMDPAIFEQRKAERPFNFADCTAPIDGGFTRVAEGDVIQIGGRRWDVRMGNGHAPEHATFWSRDDSLILGGDQLLPSISPNIGVYATEPEGDPLGGWIESCDRLARHARDDHFVLPGHKMPFTGLPARLRQLEENHHSALDRLVAHLATPQAAGDCFMPLFGREIRGSQYGLALVEAMAHCLHLWHAGRATRALRADGAWAFRAI